MSRALEKAATRSSPAEQLPDPHAQDAYERAEHRLLTRELPRLLEMLSERERTVVCSRYGIGRHEQTLTEIGDALGVSAERIRQIEQAAIAKLSIFVS